jgi:predicted thioesterase
MKPAVAQSRGVFECIVTQEMCASLDGVDIHPVYSTFWLSYHAEIAARRAIDAFFDEGENAIGGELSLRHEAMCAVGDHVRVEARVRSVTAKKIVCDIEAFAASKRIAVGHQTQIVLPQTTIDALVQQAYDAVP